MALVTLWAVINREVNKGDLVSPLVTLPHVTQVQASEPVVIKCELGVPEYLECKAVQGVITHKQAEIMTAIAKAESNLNPRAKNKRSTASGVFQIIAGTWYSNDCVGDKWNWKDNTDCAIKILKNQGYYAWEVYNTGSYKKYLNQ